MTGEIRIDGRLRLNRPSDQQPLERKFSNITLDQTGADWILSTEPIIATGTGTTLPLGNVGDGADKLGMAMFHNYDGAITIEVGDVIAAAFVPFLSLKFGEWSGPLRLSDNITILTAKAASGTPTLEYWLIED